MPWGTELNADETRLNCCADASDIALPSFSCEGHQLSSENSRGSQTRASAPLTRNYAQHKGKRLARKCRLSSSQAELTGRRHGRQQGVIVWFFRESPIVLLRALELAQGQPSRMRRTRGAARSSDVRASARCPWPKSCQSQTQRRLPPRLPPPAVGGHTLTLSAQPNKLAQVYDEQLPPLRYREENVRPPRL